MLTDTKYVLFDNDGTLVDTYDAIMESMHYALNTVLGHDLPTEHIASKVGIPLVEQMRQFADDPSQVDDLVKTYRAHNERDLSSRIGTFEGLDAALAQLKDAGYRLGVVTSKRRLVALDGLVHFGYDQYFDLVNGVEASTAHKPDPEPLINAAKALCVYPDQCVYVGDSPFDMRAAKSAGMHAVAVTWGRFFDGMTLAKEEPDAIIHEPSQLLAAIKLLG